MSKSIRFDKEEDEARQERLLNQVKAAGRGPTVPKGKFHSERIKPRKRKATKRELRETERIYNSSLNEDRNDEE